MSKRPFVSLTRRDFLRTGALGVAGLTMAAASPLAAQQVGLETELVSAWDVTLNPPQVVGPTPDGLRQIIMVEGGTASGPKINGTWLPGGGDWLRVRSDGVFVLDVRGTLQLDDESLAFVHYPGYAVTSPEVFNRITSGEEVDGSEYYFRVTPRFETASEQYGWLNSAIFVGIGRIGPFLASVHYDVYQVL